MKGKALLEAINRARRALGLGPTSALELEPCEHDDRVGRVACAIARALQCSIGIDTATRQYELQFADPERAARVMESWGDGELLESGAVPVPEALDSLLPAEGFGLIFRGQDGCLKGWIEPTDRDQAVWDLFLMPGYVYPPGSEPGDGVIRETVFDSTRYLPGLDAGVEQPGADIQPPVALFLAGGPLSGKTTIF